MTDREYISVPDLSSFAHFHKATRQGVAVRLGLAQELARYADQHLSSATLYQSPRTDHLMTAAERERKFVPPPTSQHLYSINLGGQLSQPDGMNGINVLHFGWRGLEDRQCHYASMVRGQQSSNDFLWQRELDKYMLQHRLGSLGALGSLYEYLKERRYFGFALGGPGYPQPVDFLLADPRLYHGGFDDVLVRDASAFVARGTIFSQNNILSAQTARIPV